VGERFELQAEFVPCLLQQVQLVVGVAPLALEAGLEFDEAQLLLNDQFLRVGGRGLQRCQVPGQGKMAVMQATMAEQYRDEQRQDDDQGRGEDEQEQGKRDVREQRREEIDEGRCRRLILHADVIPVNGGRGNRRFGGLPGRSWFRWPDGSGPRERGVASQAGRKRPCRTAQPGGQISCPASAPLLRTSR